jgi:hypothetical protein
MFDHETKRSRGFGFIVFASEQVVDDLLANGNMVDLAGSKVSLQFIIEMTPMVVSSIVDLWCKICKVVFCILVFQVICCANFMEHHA